MHGASCGTPAGSLPADVAAEALRSAAPDATIAPPATFSISRRFMFFGCRVSMSALLLDERVQIEETPERLSAGRASRRNLNQVVDARGAVAVGHEQLRMVEGGLLVAHPLVGEREQE